MIGYVISGLAGWLAGAAANRAADVLPELPVGGGAALAPVAPNVAKGKHPERSTVALSPCEAEGCDSQARRSGLLRLRSAQTTGGTPLRTPPLSATFGISALAHAFTLPWYFLRRGVCPHCGERRPLRAPLLEAASIAAFLFAWGRFHADPLHTALVCLYAAFLLIVLVIDYERRRVLNIMLAPAAIVALLASLLPGDPTPLQALLGGAIGFGVFFLIALIGRGKMGWGDVKLAGVIGLMTGYPAVIPALVLGVLLGGLAAIVLLITRRAGRKSTMAYAPYLALGAVIVLLLG